GLSDRARGMTQWPMNCRPYFGAIWGRGFFRRTLVLLLMIGTMLGGFSEVAGFMYVAKDYHLVLKDSFLYASWGHTPEDREYDAEHALKRSEPCVIDLWAGDHRMGLRLTNVHFNPWRSRFRVPWFESLPGTGSSCLPLVWFYLGFLALVGI